MVVEEEGRGREYDIRKVVEKEGARGLGPESSLKMLRVVPC